MYKVLNILKAEYLGDYRLRLSFDDKTEQVLDFYPFLSRAAHPDIRAYLEPARFQTYRIEYGELVWGDYELCFPIIDLYRNNLCHAAPLELAA
jgi:hypothetical protein